MKKQILLLMITSSAIIFASDPKVAQSTAKIQNQDPEQFNSFNKISILKRVIWKLTVKV